MRARVYLDTSALAKWYINELGSADVESFIREHAPCAISALTGVEMRSLLARRRREGSIDARLESRLFAAFLEDVRLGFLVEQRVMERAAEGAVNLIAALPEHPLRTLDALHLAIAREAGLSTIVTSDRVMAAAAEALDFEVVTFTR